jgi:peptidylprolyl isomerase
MTLEKGTLILVDYAARIKDTNQIFETTSEEEAKKNDLYDPARQYGPKLLSIGEGWVLKGVDEALLSANSGDKLKIEVLPDKGFGEREPNKVRMVAQRKLGEKSDQIQVGDEVELNQRKGTVRYIGSGRVQVDFNHKYAGRVLLYDINILKKVETDDEKIFHLIKRRLPLDDQVIRFRINGTTVEVELPEEVFLSEGLQVMKRAIANDIFKFMGSARNIKFIENYKSQEQVKLETNSSETSKEMLETVENNTA